MSLTFHCNPPTALMITSVSIQVFQTKDRERRTTPCPLQMQRALIWGHLPVLQPAKVSSPGDVRENTVSHIGGSEIPTIYNTILIAPPIGLEDKLRLWGGNFLSSSPSAPAPGGADWPGPANTSRRAGRPPTAQMHVKWSSTEPRREL